MNRPRPSDRPSRRARLRPGLEPLEARALLAVSGTLDPAFATGGIYSAPITSGPGVEQVVVQPDGSVVAVGNALLAGGSSPAASIFRLTPSGKLDTTFGAGGQAQLPLPTSFSLESVSGLALQGDGKIDVVGQIGSGMGSMSRGEGFVARLDADGTPDTTFGTGGILVIGSSTAGVTGATFGALAVQPNDDIVLTGSAPIPTRMASTEVVVARLNADGSIDTTFGTGGAVTISTLTAADLASTTTFQETGTTTSITPGGQVLVGSGLYPFIASGGNGYEHFNVFRLNADGSMDSSLVQSNVEASLAAGDAAFVVSPLAEVQATPDGQILVLGGTTTAPSTLFLLNADGTRDTMFFKPSVVFSSFAQQSDGKIVLAGQYLSAPFQAGGFLAIRLNPALTPDLTFGSAGKATIPIPVPLGSSGATTGGYVQPTASSIAIASNGDLVLGGLLDRYTTSAGNSPVSTIAAIAAITSTGGSRAIPGDYLGNGFSDPAVYLPNLGEYAVRPSFGIADQLIPFGVAGAGQTIPAPADYTGSGVAEIGAYLSSYGVYAYRPAGGGPDVTVPFGIPGAGNTIPAPADYEGTGKADIAVYLPTLGAFGIRPSTGGPDEIIPFGIKGAGNSIPAPADYEGTGKADVAVYLPSLGAFGIRPSTGGPDQIIPFGIKGAGNSIPIPGDYDGSGHVELAVYLPKLGEFAYRPYGGGPDVIEAFGIANDGSLPVPGDYSGSGHDEIAVYDAAHGFLAYRSGTVGPDVIESFGPAGVGQSVPAAAPPGSQPEFAAVSTASVRAAAVAVGPATGPASLASERAMVSATAAVPAGPNLSARRVALAPVNQGRPDPWATGP